MGVSAFIFIVLSVSTVCKIHILVVIFFVVVNDLGCSLGHFFFKLYKVFTKTITKQLQNNYKKVSNVCMKKYKTLKTIYNGIEISMKNNNIDEIYANGELLRQWEIEELHRIYCGGVKQPNGKYLFTSRSRLVAALYHGLPKDYKHLQVDHIDSDSMNDDPSNLRWVTRKTNNSTERKRKLNTINHKVTSHRSEVIEARKDDKVKYFKNGSLAAKALDCSHVLVYNVLNKDHYAKTAKGWKLRWIKQDEMKI